jgi:hypothetical protein
MKTLLITAIMTALFVSCSNDETVITADENENVAIANRGCATNEVLAQQLKEDPYLAIRMNEIEEFTNRAIKEGRIVNGTITIPVVVNVLYRTTAQNISLAQIQSQIDVLNKDFNATNSDFSSVPPEFSGVKANVGISFILAKTIRKYTKKTSWWPDESMKKTSLGGIDPTDPTTKMNLWVCNLSRGYLGYAQFPGGNPATDGIVIDDNAMGNTGTASSPYNLGRTATHEVGHWMNLRHIWGDATCGNDFVDDTPLHDSPNYGAPAYPHFSKCPPEYPLEMTMNYMDYTYDRAMFMFSLGQNQRINPMFATGGPRSSYIQP